MREIVARKRTLVTTVTRYKSQILAQDIVISLIINVRLATLSKIVPMLEPRPATNVEEWVTFSASVHPSKVNTRHSEPN